MHINKKKTREVFHFNKNVNYLKLFLLVEQQLFSELVIKCIVAHNLMGMKTSKIYAKRNIYSNDIYLTIVISNLNINIIVPLLLHDSIVVHI